MTRKQLPLILMLIAGAVTSLTVYFRGLGLKTMSIALLATLVAFYFLGSVIKLILDSFDKKNEDEVSEEGEVIEKEASEETEEESVETLEEGEESEV